MDNFKKVKRVLWAILFANLAVAVLKIIIGNLVKSASMTADGFHSLSDGASNIIGLIGISIASKPVDKDHPYGHSKFETLAGLIIAGMLFFIGGKIIFDAVTRFINPVTPQISLESLIALIITLCVNISVCLYEYKQGKMLNSQILISDSLHTKSDIWVSSGVLITLISVKLGLPSFVDPLASMVISVFILRASYEIFNNTSGVLVDKAPVDSLKIREITMNFEQVKDVHNIRSRGSENEIHIDMHVMTKPDMSVEESHALIHDIEDKIRQELCGNIQVIAHIEPYNK